MSEQFDDPITEPVQQLIDVFREKLSTVSFPDVSLDLLNSIVEKVRTARKTVQETQKLLEDAHHELSGASDELQQKCARALAYARVYAEGNEELTELLSSINLGKSVRAAKKAASSAKSGSGRAVPARKRRSTSVDEAPGADDA